jgi:hypothetical protein
MHITTRKHTIVPALGLRLMCRGLLHHNRARLLRTVRHLYLASSQARIQNLAATHPT